MTSYLFSHRLVLVLEIKTHYIVLDIEDKCEYMRGTDRKDCPKKDCLRIYMIKWRVLHIDEQLRFVMPLHQPYVPTLEKRTKAYTAGLKP